MDVRCLDDGRVRVDLGDEGLHSALHLCDVIEGSQTDVSLHIHTYIHINMTTTGQYERGKYLDSAFRGELVQCPRGAGYLGGLERRLRVEVVLVLRK